MTNPPGPDSGSRGSFVLWVGGVALLVVLSLTIIVWLVVQGGRLTQPEATVAGALTALTAASVALLGVVITRHQTGQHFALTHRLDQIRALRERYTETASQLGADSYSMRLAGVYGMAALADDWHNAGNDAERQVCVDVLCACLRTPPPQRSGPYDPVAETAADRERSIRRAIVGIIRTRAKRGKGQWAGLRFDLAGARLGGMDLNNADLSGADLSGAYLYGADLRGALHDNATRWPGGFAPLPPRM